MYNPCLLLLKLFIAHTAKPLISQSPLAILKYNYSLIQIDAAISKGSSGGPVANKKGEVVGITVSKLNIQDAQNLNFAVPTKYLEFLMRD
jgi:S1-C subfamily serine protease